MRPIKFRLRIKWGDLGQGESISFTTLTFPELLATQIFGEILSVDLFIGLKDKNGKEIYEGDILCQELFGGLKTYISIEWFQDSCCFGYKGHPFDHVSLTEEKAGWYEIIGNIYENPELVDVPLTRGQESQDQ